MITKLCQLMIDQGRVVSFNDTIKRFKQDGSETDGSIRINKCKSGNERAYWNVSINGKYKLLPISRLTWMAHGNKMEEGKTLDHIDRNSRNDSIHNLRLATQAEQNQNRTNTKTTPEMRSFMQERFKSKSGTIRGMATEYGLDRSTVQDIIHMKYKYDQKLERQG